MLRCNLNSVFILSLIGIIYAQYASASHVAGGFIRYQSTGVPHQYNINLTLYRYCAGIQMNVNNPVIYFRRTCGGTPFGETLVFNTSSGQAVPQYCANSPSLCNGGTRYGLQKYVWEDIVTLPFDASNPDCNRWTLTWGNNSVDGFPARNNSNTLLNGGGTNFFIDAYLDDNVLNPQTAPLFVDSLVPAYCINQPVAVNFNAVDPDGDSLAFGLVPAQSAYNTPVVYATGYSAAQPALSTGGISVNPANGNITFTTSNPQTTLFVLRMEKYRNGVLIGYIKFDVQVLLGAFPYCVPIFSSVVLTGCAQVNLPSGPVTQSGTYVDSFFSADCKDSIVTYQVTINQPTSITLNQVICGPATFTVGAQNFGTTGMYVVNLVNASGCDSVVTLNLTVNQPSSTILNRTICSPSVVSVGNQTFGTTGTYVIQLNNSNGCDSIITLNLVVNQPGSSVLNTTLCAPQTISIGNQVFSTTGTYVVNILTSNGCDSVVTLNLTVRQPSSTFLTRVLCSPATFSIGTQAFGATGTYTVTLTNTVGCDSVVNLNLTVNQPSTVVLNPNICSPATFQVDTFTFSTTGSYTINLLNMTGCDSIVFLNLTVNQTEATVLNADICTPQTIVVGNQTFNSTGVYVIPLRSSLDCDSVVTLNLNVRQSSTTVLYDTACDSYNWSGQLITQTGRYSRILRNRADCDSVVELNLMIEQTPPSPIALDTSVCAKSYVPITYSGSMWGRLEWYRDNNLTDLIGMGSSVSIGLLLDTTDIYLVFRSPSGCSSQKSTVRIINEDERMKSVIPNAFSPNFDNRNDVWEVQWNYPMELTVFDRWGMLIWEDKGSIVRWDGGEYSPGTYSYIIRYMGCTDRVKFRKGLIQLIR